MCVSFWSLSNTPTQTILSCQWVQTPLDHPLSDFVIFEHSLILALDKQNYSANISPSFVMILDNNSGLRIHDYFQSTYQENILDNSVSSIFFYQHFQSFKTILECFRLQRLPHIISSLSDFLSINRIFISTSHITMVSSSYQEIKKKIHNFLDHSLYLPPYIRD